MEMELRNIVVADVLDAITVHSVKGKTTKMKNRYCYGLSFCSEGQITYIQDGKNYISDSTHAVILPKGGCYDIVRNKTGDFPVINFDVSGFLCDRIIEIQIKDTEYLFHCFEQIKKAILLPDERLRIISVFYDMLHAISTDKSSALLAPALRFIENNFSKEDLTNAALAEECRISEVYFRRIFRKELGVTPRQYIIDMRISRAKQLLSEGQKKISAIAEECGFSSTYHFCRSFKERVGTTPSEFRSQNTISLL